MARQVTEKEMGICAGKALFGMGPEELRRVVEGLGLPKYRAVQISEALYKERVRDLGEITTLPAAVREELAAAGLAVGVPEIVQTATSVDGTERYLIRMADGETVETVWMPNGDGGERGDGSEAGEEEEDAREQGSGNREQKDKHGDSLALPQNDERNQGGYKRATICVSSQVGCAVNCQFCLTAKLGVKRNLTAGEIAGQVAAVLNRHKVRVGSGKGVETPSRINLVFMGMGEPFLNYDAFMKAVHLLRGMGIPESRMTVSTSGIEPAIRRFAQEPVRPKLALSLNAPNDAIRREIMPITKKWDIAALLEALKTIPFGKREYVTFEYVLLGGVNDRPEDAREVLSLLKGMKAKVNLIVWNPGPGIAYTQPKPDDVAVFHRMLVEGGIPTFTRRPRGRDIYAACGQLKRTVDDAPELVSLC
ncbi:MAG TPA: 23S rRNA (adenine(2503)-C(2))-methyltransferase RlmN [Acidobacteriaceae bacterium]|nr:23S rRNA (adenine(2503)-C(2))-methyltransferase RlmN [Acidobacteriaceae bacterium]